MPSKKKVRDVLNNEDMLELEDVEVVEGGGYSVVEDDEVIVELNEEYVSKVRQVLEDNNLSVDECYVVEDSDLPGRRILTFE